MIFHDEGGGGVSQKVIFDDNGGGGVQTPLKKMTSFVNSPYGQARFVYQARLVFLNIIKHYRCTTFYTMLF